MVVDLRVNFEITDNCVNNLEVGPIPAVENLKLPFEDRQQLLVASREPRTYRKAYILTNGWRRRPYQDLIVRLSQSALSQRSYWARIDRGVGARVS